MRAASWRPTRPSDNRGDFEVISSVVRPSEATTGHRKCLTYTIYMNNKYLNKPVSQLSDDELLHRLSELLQDSRRVEADLVAHIGELDERHLYRRSSSSMFKYSTEVLHLSEAEAYLRIEVARTSRKHPVLLDMLSDGRLHLSGIAVLAPILTEANRESVLARAMHKTKQKIKELVAELAPKPDVPSSIRKLPQRRDKSEPAAAPELELRLDGVNSETAATPTPAPSTPLLVEPIAEARYKVAFTASASFRDKLERLPSTHALICSKWRPGHNPRGSGDGKTREARIQALWHDQDSEKKSRGDRYVSFFASYPVSSQARRLRAG